MKEKVLAGIVTYYPDISKLRCTIESIICQVNQVIVYDNATKNICEIELLLKKYDVKQYKSKTNVGLARAYNQIFKYAQKNCFDWVITLDQDTDCPSNLISEAEKYFTNPRIGIIVPSIIEKNYGKALGYKRYVPEKGMPESDKVIYVRKCINSGALISVRAYAKTNGYDEKFFIDYVDFDFSMKVQNAGYCILMMKYVFIDHEIGKSECVSFLGRQVRYSRHSDIREYYIGRNIVIYIKRYWKKISVIGDLLSLAKQYVFIVFYDDDKASKLRALSRGVLKGISIHS